MNKLEHLIASCSLGNGRDAKEHKSTKQLYCPYISPENGYTCPKIGEKKVFDIGYGKHEVLREVYLCNWRGDD